MFKLFLARCTISQLSSLGKKVRDTIRLILHAAKNLSKKWIHLELRKGGLGIPDPLEMVYLGKKRIWGVLRDNVGEAGLWKGEVGVLTEHLVRRRGLDPDKFSASLQQFRWDTWRSSVQGKGAEAFVGIDNSFWLRSCGLQSREKGGFLIFGVKLRTQTLPCRETLVRGRGQDICQCRHCGNGPETVVHILQRCTQTLKGRIERHNRILDVVKR